jgi:hypothetical protein
MSDKRRATCAGSVSQRIAAHAARHEVFHDHDGLVRTGVRTGVEATRAVDRNMQLRPGKTHLVEIHRAHRGAVFLEATLDDETRAIQGPDPSV